MKHIIFKAFLKVSKRISASIQIGNPIKIAPVLVDKPKNDERLFVREHLGTEISIWQLERAICFISFYNGAVISKNNELYSNFISFPWGKELHPAISIPYLGKNHLNLDKAIFLFTPEAKGNYYHWMIDLLPRLLFLRSAIRNEFDSAKLIIHNQAKSYEKQTLLLLGISIENIIRIDPYKIVNAKKLIIPDYIDYEENFPEWKKELLIEFKSKVIENKHFETWKRIYLVRGKQRIRRLVGEEKLINILHEHGIKIIDPQKLSLEEQIFIFSQANVVIALHGAALTNIVFCNEGTEVIEFRSNNLSPEYFSEISKACKLNFYTICLPPQKFYKKKHIANKANIILTDKGIDELLLKLKNSD